MMRKVNVEVLDSHIYVLNGKMAINIKDVASHLYFRENDIVLLGGSLIDGFGSSTSDLDIYVLSDTSPNISDFRANKHHRHVARDGKLISVTDYMTSTGMILDTQYRTKDQIRALLTSTRNAYTDAAGRTKMLINSMQEADHKTVYRLYSAIVLQGKSDFEELMESGLSQEQFCYLLFRNIAGHYPLLNDVAGAWRDGDLVEGCERARLFVSKIAYALTHMFGNTNAEMKWIYRALQALPQEYASLVERYFELSLRGVREAGEMKQLILDCLDLADDFFSASRDLLDSTPSFMSKDDSERITRQEINGYKSWHRDLTKEFAIRCRLFRDGLPPLTEFLPKQESKSLLSYLKETDLKPGPGVMVPS